MLKDHKWIALETRYYWLVANGKGVIALVLVVSEGFLVAMVSFCGGTRPNRWVGCDGGMEVYPVVVPEV